MMLHLEKMGYSRVSLVQVRHSFEVSTVQFMCFFMKNMNGCSREDEGTLIWMS